MERRSNGIVYFALVIAIVALAVSGIAYARRVTTPVTNPAREPATLKLSMVVATFSGQGMAAHRWYPTMLVMRQGDTVDLAVGNPDKVNHRLEITGYNRWKALNPGLYVYHCASPHIPTHIANGMYGMILVEPAGGLPKVDREYYVMQGEFYTKGALGAKGLQKYDIDKAKLAQPDYVVFNGKVGALTGRAALTGKVGETVRIFFGNGGPNLVSSFHVIGEIFDRVYPEGAVGSAPNAVCPHHDEIGGGLPGGVENHGPG